MGRSKCVNWKELKIKTQSYWWVLFPQSAWIIQQKAYLVYLYLQAVSAYGQKRNTRMTAMTTLSHLSTLLACGHSRSRTGKILYYMAPIYAWNMHIGYMNQVEVVKIWRNLSNWTKIQFFMHDYSLVALPVDCKCLFNERFKAAGKLLCYNYMISWNSSSS